MFKKKEIKFDKIEDINTKYDIIRSGDVEEVHTKTFYLPPSVNSKLRIDDELEPSRYLLLEFKETHDSWYMGINDIKFHDENGCEVSYENVAVDGDTVDHINVRPALPFDGLWTVNGTDHSLLCDFQKETRVTFVHVKCANDASTPKVLHVTDAMARKHYDEECAEIVCFQLAGEPKSPDDIRFRSECNSQKDLLDRHQIIKTMNLWDAQKRFGEFLSEDGKDLFVFHAEGLKTRAYNYYFGRHDDPLLSVALANSIILNHVSMKNSNNANVKNGTGGLGSADVDATSCEHRTMNITELRAVRAMIVSDCVKNKWKSGSSNPKTAIRLRPSDVNFNDLNTILIQSLTKKRKCSFKELFRHSSSMKSSPTFYVSHWWGGSVLDFIRCCEYHARMHNLDDDEANYWICAFGTQPQDMDVNPDAEKSSFFKAMKAAGRVLLILDPKVATLSRIWVQYELHLALSNNIPVDVCMFDEGGVRLIASNEHSAGVNLPNEVSYQRTRREAKFPLRQVWKHFLNIQLHKGEATQITDKVRILHQMCRAHKRSADKNMGIDINDCIILKLIKDGDSKVVDSLAKADGALRSKMAQRAIPIALCTEGQSITNFYGFNLVDIIGKDKACTDLDFDGLEGVSDDVFIALVDMISPNMDSFVLNVEGCPNLTDECIQRSHSTNGLKFPKTLKKLFLGIGHARNISNDAVETLAKAIPEDLEHLILDVTGFKGLDGIYLPLRYNNHLRALAENMPHLISTFQLTTTLASEVESVGGLIDLASSFSSNLKTFSLTLYWDNFTHECLVAMVSQLPSSIESLALSVHGGQYVDDSHLIKLREACLDQFVHLKSFTLNLRDSGKMGFYAERDFDTFEAFSDACSL